MSADVIPHEFPTGQDIDGALTVLRSEKGQAHPCANCGCLTRTTRYLVWSLIRKTIGPCCKNCRGLFPPDVERSRFIRHLLKNKF